MRVRRRDLQVAYEMTGFPAPHTNGSFELDIGWDDILWSAVTIGRPDMPHVFRHREASAYEAIFRWSMIRMALEQAGPGGRRLRRTNAFKALDPTEKGAVNCFLGMVMCGVFASKLLGTHWLLHLDVFRKELDIRLFPGRSRPDLVGRDASGGWHVFESKGRASKPSTNDIAKAKGQVQRIGRIDAAVPQLCIGAFSYFRGDILRFSWIDPPTVDEGVILPEPEGMWRYKYEALWEVSRLFDTSEKSSDEPIYIEPADVFVEFHPKIRRLLENGEWDQLVQVASNLAVEFKELGFRADGTQIKAGETWRNRFESPNGRPDSLRQ